jgi:hypothetical protein
MKFKQIILCECGEFIDGHTFKDYIETTSNPSTPTIGHTNCGLIFNFIDDDIPKRYSSKTELKSLAMKFAEKNKMSNELIESFLINVDRLKSSGKLSDCSILVKAYRSVVLEER